ncbi:MAG TPA: GNAT family N-acetyltransferase [Gemmatimonadaceae bacterium]|nr:GNAT family N-acetyltransferase [Gemmatimonadaceae bacterium]
MTKTSSPPASGPARIDAPRGDQIVWQWSRFSELSPEQLYAIVRLREAVFVVEQQCPYPDADGRDPNAWHLLGWYETDGKRDLVAYARVFEPGVRYTEGSIGRIVTAPSVRGTGIGRALMAEGLRRTEILMPGQRIKIAAQQRLVDFYIGFGFTVVSAPYDEDGIMHVDMVR